MATTAKLNLTYLEIGQRDKSTTINSNYDIIDGLPRFLGDLSADPSPTNVAQGSTYFNITSSKLKVLRGNNSWVNVA